MTIERVVRVSAFRRPHVRGAIWFTTFSGCGGIGRVSAGTVLVFTTPCIGYVDSAASRPDGLLWFVSDIASVGTMTTGGIVTACGDEGVTHPSAVAAGPDGAMWITGELDQIGRIPVRTGP